MSIAKFFGFIWPLVMGFIGFWFVFIPALQGVFNGATVIGWVLVSLALMKMIGKNNVR